MITPAPPSATFEEAWEATAPIKGWLTRDQARMLWDGARSLPHGATLVEIGSHQGRSTLVLAKAVQPNGGHVIAIDPFVDGKLFGGQQTKVIMIDNLTRSSVQDTVELVPDYSTRLRPQWSRPFEFLYIDGKHDYWTVSDDLKWAERLPPDAPVFIHDAFSSIGVTLGILVHVLPSKRLRYVGRAGSLAHFVVRAPGSRDRGRILAEMPWWLRNVFVKVLLRLRLRTLARLLGHDSPYDPY